MVMLRQAVVRQATVVGGGTIMMLGTAEVEFQLFDEVKQSWSSFKETFCLVEGSPTYILGMTFQAKQHANICLQQNMVRYSTEFKSCTTKVSTCSHGMVASVMTLNDPLVYTAEAALIEGNAWTTMELSVPSAMGVETRPADAHMHTAVAGCERFNHTLREMARACHFDHGYEWDLMLPLIITWYKNLVQTSTGFSPFYMNHGRDPRPEGVQTAERGSRRMCSQCRPRC